MNTLSLSVSTQNMKALARYETTLKDLALSSGLLDEEYQKGLSLDLHFEGTFPFSLNDLAKALQNLARKNPDIDGFYYDWYLPLSDHAGIFSLPQNRQSVPDRWRDDFPLPVCEEICFRRIWSALSASWQKAGPEASFRDAIPVEDLLSDIQSPFRRQTDLDLFGGGSRGFHPVLRGP